MSSALNIFRLMCLGHPRGDHIIHTEGSSCSREIYGSYSECVGVDEITQRAHGGKRRSQGWDFEEDRLLRDQQ